MFPVSVHNLDLPSPRQDPRASFATVRDETLRAMLSTPPQPRKRRGKKKVNSK